MTKITKKEYTNLLSNCRKQGILHFFFLSAISSIFLFILFINSVLASEPVVKLGNEVLLEECFHLIEGKKVGLITNQTGVDSKGVSLIENILSTHQVKLIALFAPEHGLDGKTKAGTQVGFHNHPLYDIPVYSLYGNTRMPTEEMLFSIEVLVFDIQDIGARTYTYMSTLQYCMVAAAKYKKPIIVLDRPNILGGMIVEGPVLEGGFKSFVGVDNLPMAHGMTVGELAQFYNRNIGADLTVIPMKGYHRDMTFSETGLPFVQTSPNIPDLYSAYGYMATGMGEGTGVFQRDQFRWVGGKGLDSYQYAELLNNAELPGVWYIPEERDTAGGVRLDIYDPSIFNPAKSGIYSLAYAFILGNFQVPKSTSGSIVMFDKIMGTDKIGQFLEAKVPPEEIIEYYTPELEQFKKERENYLIPFYQPPGF
jgi:uncharacterized protein YbbC (DUF1343 family)